MNYCIIRSGNKQHQVKIGSVIQIELLDQTTGPVIFDEVLLHVDGDQVDLGTPILSDFKVYGTALGLVKADKIQVFKYKSKSRYRKLRGHRQQYVSVKIESFGTAPAKATTPVQKELKLKAPAKKTVTKKAPAKAPVAKAPKAKKTAK